MKKRWSILLLASAPLVFAQKYTKIAGLPEVPRLDVQQAPGAITVDGRLDEKAWSAAEPVALLFPWDSQTGARQKTTVKLVYDASRLYAGYECDDADITAVHENRDDPTYRDDCVEIFIKPSARSDGYVGLEMNARGVLYDYLYPFPAELDKSLTLEGVELRTTVRGTLNASGDRDQGWTLEVAIPFTGLARLAERVPPRPADSWRIQLNRWDGTEASGGRRLSMWTHSGLERPHPHNPERFGVVFFR